MIYICIVGVPPGVCSTWCVWGEILRWKYKFVHVLSNYYSKDYGTTESTPCPITPRKKGTKKTNMKWVASEWTASKHRHHDTIKSFANNFHKIGNISRCYRVVYRSNVRIGSWLLLPFREILFQMCQLPPTPYRTVVRTAAYYYCYSILAGCSSPRLRLLSLRFFLSLSPLPKNSFLLGKNDDPSSLKHHRFTNQKHTQTPMHGTSFRQSAATVDIKRSAIVFHQIEPDFCV